jgi:hypothetical protein
VVVFLGFFHEGGITIILASPILIGRGIGDFFGYFSEKYSAATHIHNISHRIDMLYKLSSKNNNL